MTKLELDELINSKFALSPEVEIKICIAPTKESFVTKISSLENHSKVYNLEKEAIYIPHENTLYIRGW